MKSLHEYCTELRDDRLLRQWHPELNGGLTPKDVASGSGKKVWWICEKGHEWEASIVLRTGHSSGCPYCAGKKVLAGYNDLATVNPEVAAQWHPELNGDLTPKDVAPAGAKKVWWICEKGHEWEASIVSRTVQSTGCPYCTSRKVLAGFNDLATVHPRLAVQWHPELNGGLTPEQVAPSSNKKAWWMCEKGHEWQATIVSRTVQSTGCPYCSGHKVLIGFNDLATVNPEVAAQWHPELNGDLTPEQVTRGCRKKVWWICEKGHKWEARISFRAGTAKTGCPFCFGRKNRYKAIMDNKT